MCYSHRSRWRTFPLTSVALFMAIVMALAVMIALGFQYIGGFMPCRLCLDERRLYYIAIPLSLVIAGLSLTKLPVILVRLLFLVVAFIMFLEFALSVYHAGAEYQFWKGPSDCSAATAIITYQATDLLSNLNSVRPVACDRAPGYFIGLSFAGWNAVIAFVLGFIGVIGGILPLPAKTSDG